MKSPGKINNSGNGPVLLPPDGGGRGGGQSGNGNGQGKVYAFVGLAILLLPVLVNLVTLPVEWDASFKRALPVLIAGEYIPESAVPIAKQILTAAALTYLAASLASLLNFYRWVAFLRR